MPRRKKFERFKINEHKYPSGNTRWQVSGTKRDGKRVREYFHHKAEALDRKGELEKDYHDEVIEKVLRRTSLSEDQLADAETALELNADSSLSTTITHYLKLIERANETGVSLDAAISFCEKHYRPEIDERSIQGAVSEFMKTRAACRPKTISDYSTSTNLLLQIGPDRPVHTVSLSSIEKILNKYKNLNTKKTYRRGFNTFFRWCQNHSYILENPCSRLDKIQSDRSRINILSLEECQRLLKAAMLYKDGIMLPGIALGLFAGLRPSEIEDLTKKNIKKDFILVEGGKLRRKLKRKVPITENLKEWLEYKPFKGLPPGYRDKLRALKTATKAKKWAQDVIRHTSISFQSDRDEDEGRTAYRNGTSKAMIDSHYREVIEETEHVTLFWSLTPGMIKDAKIQIELPPASQKVTWPTDTKLKKLVWAKPLSRLAVDLNVSDNAIRKRCKQHGIELPKNGHWQRQHSRATLQS